MKLLDHLEEIQIFHCLVSYRTWDFLEIFGEEGLTPCLMRKWN